jgi:t-SNARE complex subunit (syntaxin)
VIDTIDAHIESTTVDVQEASKEVSKAIDYRKASRKRWRVLCILVTVLVIVLGIVGFFTWIKPTFIDSQKKQ